MIFRRPAPNCFFCCKLIFSATLKRLLFTFWLQSLFNCVGGHDFQRMVFLHADINAERQQSRLEWLRRICAQRMLNFHRRSKTSHFYMMASFKNSNQVSLLISLLLFFEGSLIFHIFLQTKVFFAPFFFSLDLIVPFNSIVCSLFFFPLFYPIFSRSFFVFHLLCDYRASSK